MNKLIWEIVGIVVFLCIWFGFVGPYCISAPVTVLVIGWVAITLVLFVVALIKTIKFIKKTIKNGDEE